MKKTTHKIQPMQSNSNKIQPFPVAWPDFFLALPQSIAQSAVFGLSFRIGRRPAFEDIEVFSWGTKHIFFTGFALDQFDLDVWLFCIDSAKSSNSSLLNLTRRQICRGLQIGQGKKEINRVENSISRLFSATIKIKDSKKEPLFFSLLQSVQGEKNKLNIGFAPDLFSAMRHAAFIDQGRHHALTLPLAKKLHVLFSTQSQKKHILLLENLVFLVGQEGIPKKEFARKIRAALAQLQDVGIIESWAIDSRKISYFLRENQ